MNCARCNAPLMPEARFCRNCGLAVSSVSSRPENAVQASQPGIGDSPTVLTSPWQAQQAAPSQIQDPTPQSVPPQAYQPTIAVSPSPGSLPSAGAKPFLTPQATRQRKRLVQVLLILAVALLVVAILVVSGWFLAVRPVLHGMAQNQVDSVLNSAVNQIPPTGVLFLPRGSSTVPITEADMNNFIASNTSSADLVQQVHMTITPAVVQLNFQTYGLTSTVTGVPVAVNGQIEVTHVMVQGVAGLLLSPEELTATLNAHLQEAGLRLHRVATGVVLKNGEMDIQLK